jgi:hypothetical protein
VAYDDNTIYCFCLAATCGIQCALQQGFGPFAQSGFGPKSGHLEPSAKKPGCVMRLPILKITPKRVYTERWSHYKVINGQVRGMGQRRSVALNRQKLEAGGYCRDGSCYSLNQDEVY